MTSRTTASERPGPSGRIRGAIRGLLVGIVAGSICAFGLSSIYCYVFYQYLGGLTSDGAIFLFEVFLTIGAGSGAVLGAILGLFNAPRRQRGVPTSSSGKGVAPRDALAGFGWTVLGMMVGGALGGAAVLGACLLYYNLFPRVPDEGTSGYAIFLVILPAGIVIGSICGAAAGCFMSAPRSLK